jgi:hypothetical protein
MNPRKEFAEAAGMLRYVRRLEAVIIEAMRRLYAAHVEKTEMRLAPIKPNRDRAQLYRD